MLVCGRAPFAWHTFGRHALQLSVGAVRAKNAKNIILKILLDACFGALAFYIFGFAFAYGGDFDNSGKGNSFVGYGGFALNDVAKTQWYNWFFQWAVRRPARRHCTRNTRSAAIWFTSTLGR